MDCIQQYRTYIEFEDLKEKYEIQSPVLSVHNLIIGTPYIDIGGTMKAQLLPKFEGTKGGSDCSVVCTLRMTKKGWFSKEEYKVEGEVTIQKPGSKKVTNIYKIDGNWNNKIVIMPFGDDGKPDESK